LAPAAISSAAQTSSATRDTTNPIGARGPRTSLARIRAVAAVISGGVRELEDRKAPRHRVG
jgi:hypothetical protein